MRTQRQIIYILATLAGLVILPYIGALLGHRGGLPANFFDYPPIHKPDAAPFSWIVFGIAAAICVVVALLYIMPGWFGFKKTVAPVEPPVPQVNFPIWFWAGVILWVVPIFFLWGHFSEPRRLLYYSDLPLFWGFTLLLDGIVYKRTGGHSIISDYPKEMIGIGSASVSGWMIFEFLNFFIHMNWWYPFGPKLSQSRFLLYALIGSSGLLPMAFEWYDLLLTVKVLKNRFSTGAKINMPLWAKILLLVIACATLVIMGFNPTAFFYIIWLSPLIILSIVLGLIGAKTPFTALKTGNWSPLLIFALAYLVQGLCMECWNYLSGIHNATGELTWTQTPAYWVYQLPYVNVYHVFEMPVLGYLGYLPFSVWCWIWWIMYAYLQGIPSKFYEKI